MCRNCINLGNGLPINNTGNCQKIAHYAFYYVCNIPYFSHTMPEYYTKWGHSILTPCHISLNEAVPSWHHYPYTWFWPSFPVWCCPCKTSHVLTNTQFHFFPPTQFRQCDLTVSDMSDRFTLNTCHSNDEKCLFHCLILFPVLHNVLHNKTWIKITN